MHPSPGSPVGVLGAGAMGAGIAQVAAASGHPVVVVDTSGEALARARAGLEAAMRREVEKGRLDAAAADAILGRVRFHGGARSEGMGVFGDCAIVIEAISEQLAAKRDTFARLDAAVADECVLATNTSSLSIAAIASACKRSERVLGVHFFNPAPLMPLVEIVPWLRTAPEVTAATRARVDGWRKTTVLAADTPGFIVNRVARPFYGEGLRIHDEGIADAATIDWAMRELGGFRMGPFELMDLIGLDVNLAVTRSVFEGFFYDPRYKPSITQERLVEAGMLGRKSGQGFYDYRDGAERPAPATDRVLGQRVVDRIVAMLINEAVDAVHWRVASPADIDLAVTKGVNYPKGLLAWGQELGFDAVLARVVALHDDYGEDRYRPSPLLKRLAREGGRLA
jgi:3-hydroxybutyryl-CoA dehydrogenase